MRRRAGAACLSVLALALVVPGLRGQDATGAWEVTWAQAVRTGPEGATEIRKWGKALLLLRQEGDSLRGTWRADVADVTWQVSGDMDGTLLRLRATRHDSDDPQLAAVESMNWEGQVLGDRVEGSMWLVLRERARPPHRRPWRGERAGGP